jgi:hypothetical protein
LVYGGSPQLYLPSFVHFVTMLCSCWLGRRQRGAETACSGISLAAKHVPEVLPDYVAVFKAGLKLQRMLLDGPELSSASWELVPTRFMPPAR